ncbi:NADPH-dependent F420 reductase [Liquorilactobacillus capillatus]|uniref:NADP oxidoreductase coenzyme F420-dependent n=1 Tax=Liquorilactobacillus capillatus DSM 19910 TaxID=1423731 RepID=A0A0R1M0U6_9LACO|nr:NAD(P)-binding domain-containing protein [Liquorilactobacillus capillatus]KRL01534.1 NADP oxidoreductase coenzyme F420-dependent [Liquorilactobacillus capillatus DSM 19910]
MTTTIGILGAGKLGTVLAQLTTAAGYHVLIAGSGHVAKIQLTVEVLIPAAVPTTIAEVCHQADIVILALPLSKYQTLSPAALAGKLVIDAMNYWWETDGNREDLTNTHYSSSEQVARYFHKSHVVKALNHMGYHDLFDEPRLQGQPGRKAIAIAGDEEKYVEETVKLVDRLGFDPVRAGSLADSGKMEPGSAVFGANVTKKELKKLLTDFSKTKYGQ